MSSVQRVANPPEVPLELTALPSLLFHFDLLISRRASPSILVSWSIRISEGSAFNRSLTASILLGFPRPLQFQEASFITYSMGGGMRPPLEGLGLVFRPIDISIVG
jgi:hypothetical protein